MSTNEARPMPTIELAKNGPYLVKNLTGLRNSKGDKLRIKAVIALCRCGGSANKPFCDGTHSKTGFSGENLSDGSMDKRDNYVGKKITIHDNRGICAHAGKCANGLPSVWRVGVEPWIDPGGADVEAIIETVRQCPSGALSYSIGGDEHRDQDRVPAVYVSKDGPYHVTGGVELKDVPRGDGASEEHYTLCRCGGSNNKPFCDGTHGYIKFQDDKN
ncbi:MAG: CDGSH iron-sulfur domain-containing protein [Gammaproteobacteria bacterium]|nr:CDGSH iron-sulfur domain-containing protein [Gammaproteobacteria bacterium]